MKKILKRLACIANYDLNTLFTLICVQCTHIFPTIKFHYHHFIILSSIFVDADVCGISCRFI